MILVASYQDEYILLPCCFPQERSGVVMLQAKMNTSCHLVSRRVHHATSGNLFVGKPIGQPIVNWWAQYMSGQATWGRSVAQTISLFTICLLTICQQPLADTSRSLGEQSLGRHWLGQLAGSLGR